MLDATPVLVICEAGESRNDVAAAIGKCGLRPICCSDWSEAQPIVARGEYSLVFCSDTLPDSDFRAVIKAVGPVPVIVLSRLAEWDAYLTALQAGAFNYIACPPDPAETGRILWSALGESSRRANFAQARV
jgi:DNA-binding NtrC family response regulator